MLGGQRIEGHVESPGGQRGNLSGIEITQRLDAGNLLGKHLATADSFGLGGHELEHALDPLPSR